ncbi:hypothetical protein BD289DRAFT_34227 [Coniella lustricola]|uniref:Uncharacterized protein n=1 Tax=Coniella lustricola TaxID=2025994 RepID=A0A2T3A2G1_9PEZI|nr:hypothetical protein BD289DRAFT_34227 [Coniella lustricola]
MMNVSILSVIWHTARRSQPSFNDNGPGRRSKQGDELTVHGATHRNVFFRPSLSIDNFRLLTLLTISVKPHKRYRSTTTAFVTRCRSTMLDADQITEPNDKSDFKSQQTPC